MKNIILIKKYRKNYLTPRQWDKFIFKKNVKIIDARKPFEYEIGTFKMLLILKLKILEILKNTFWA